MARNQKPVRISYSAARRYKECPEKHALSAKFENRLISSAFPFGKAIEGGVETMLKGGSLKDAIDVFIAKWNVEDIPKGETRPVFDNLAVEYYKSDYDYALIRADEEQEIQSWFEELFPDADEDKHWSEEFDAIVKQMSEDESKVELEELTFYNRVVWLCCLVRGKVMLKSFSEKLLPKLKLATLGKGPALQIKVNIRGDDGDEVLGYVDGIVMHEDFKEPIIVDFKTASSEYQDHALKTSEQLRTYVAALAGDVDTRRAGYIVLIKKINVEKSCDKCGHTRESGSAKNCKKDDCKGKYTVPSFDSDVQFITTKYEDSELEDVLEDYANVAAAIKHRVKFKNPNSCMAFGKRCEFYQVCWSGKKPEQLEHLKEKSDD